MRRVDGAGSRLSPRAAGRRLSDSACSPAQMLPNEPTGFEKLRKPPLGLTEASMVAEELSIANFVAQSGMQHFVKQHVSYDILRNERIVQTPIDHDGVVGVVVMSENASVSAKAPGQVPDVQTALEEFAVEIFK